ncbi:MAG: hypothetical protein R6X02_12325 [Enhygromyxa sp.]
MRAAGSLGVCSLLLLAACKGEAPAPQAAPASEAAAPELSTELGAHASKPCREAMAALLELEAASEPADARAAWAGPLRAWVEAAGLALGRDDVALIEESLTRLTEQTDPELRRRELVAIVTQVRTVALLEARRLLSAASDADPTRVPAHERASQWDDAWCMWEAGLRPLARRADALPRRGGEDWEATIVEAFTAGRAELDDPIVPKVSRQIIEKGSYAVAYRLILAHAEAPQPPAPSEAAALLEMLDDRIADRNSPGLKRMRRMLNGDPAGIDPAVIERELAVAFSKRARKYCDKAVARAELRTPGAIAEAWEGVVYSKVILPSMREALSAEGFDADAYMADWHSYLEAVESGDAETAAAVSARLVEWNCAYQERLGIAECTSSTDELE